jgi:Mrp family chromosome partitioning ATPase
MSRMLQALKNLESRTARPTSVGGPPARSAANSAPPPVHDPLPDSAAAQTADPPIDEDAPRVLTRPVRRSEPPAMVPQCPSVVVEMAAAPEGPAVAPVFVSEAAAPFVTPPLEREGDARVEAPIPRIVAALSEHRPIALRRAQPRFSGQNVSPLERSIHRLLGDPVRARPLVDLAERLHRDADQTVSKTLLVVGVGPGSSTHETLLYTAAILAERMGRVLLMDADLARRPLSEGLEFGHETGLSELLGNRETPRERCRPCALAGLSLLPAGLLRNVDLATAGPRAEEVLRQLAAEFSLVLIDGGRSGDLAATTLARLADATYFVVQLGTVEASQAQAALRDFRAAGARVLGCIAT